MHLLGTMKANQGWDDSFWMNHCCYGNKPSANTLLLKLRRFFRYLTWGWSCSDVGPVDRIRDVGGGEACGDSGFINNFHGFQVQVSGFCQQQSWERWRDKDSQTTADSHPGGSAPSAFMSNKLFTWIIVSNNIKVTRFLHFVPQI